MNIRKANGSDAKAIVDINNIVWKNTYKNILPESVFKEKEDNREEDIKKMETYIAENKVGALVVEDLGKVIGFATYGPTTVDKYKEAGEPYAIYVLDEYQGRGIGKELFNEVKKELIKEGYNGMVTKCLADNPAVLFHEKMGGVLFNTTEVLFGEFPATENFYYFENIKRN